MPNAQSVAINGPNPRPLGLGSCFGWPARTVVRTSIPALVSMLLGCQCRRRHVPVLSSAHRPDAIPVRVPSNTIAFRIHSPGAADVSTPINYRSPSLHPCAPSRSRTHAGSRTLSWRCGTSAPRLWPGLSPGLALATSSQRRHALPPELDAQGYSLRAACGL